jgi:hypothetical protein
MNRNSIADDDDDDIGDAGLLTLSLSVLIVNNCSNVKLSNKIYFGSHFSPSIYFALMYFKCLLCCFL